MSEQFNVIVIDDHPLFRKGVVQLLGLDTRFVVVPKPLVALKGWCWCKRTIPTW